MPSRAAQIAALRLPLADLPDPLPIPTIEKPFDVTIRPPGSKSITNRALLLAALADGTSTLRGPLIDADDAQVMLRAIQQLGAIVRTPAVTPGPQDTPGPLPSLQITGVAGRWKIPPGQTITLNLNNAGTATRFLTAAAILAPPDSGGIIIDGDARMRERPIGELVDALTQMGVKTKYLVNAGFPPVYVTGTPEFYDAYREVSFGKTASSQFVSAIILAGIFAGLNHPTITFTSPLTSPSYVDMTLNLIRTLGGTIQGTTDVGGRLNVGWNARAFTLDVEPDASSATYFEAAAVMQEGSRVLIQGLDVGPRGTLQGDSSFVAVLSALGARVERGQGIVAHGTGRIRPIDFDLGDMPDTAMTAAVLACFASPTPGNPTATSTLRGLRTLRVKETDRLAALQTELTKLGAKVDIFADGDDEGLRITPAPHGSAQSGRPVPPIHFDTYHDHRMAMSLALIGLRRPNVFIRNPACVAKTYPTFWQDLARLY